MAQELDMRDVGDGSWLPLIEFSVRSGVSLSTIRRKIKNNSIQYRLENGRYLILFNEANNLAARKATSVPASPANLVETEDENQSLHLISEAFEHVLKEKEQRIAMLEKRNDELEARLNELKLLIRLLEEKYEVRY